MSTDQVSIILPSEEMQSAGLKTKLSKKIQETLHVIGDMTIMASGYSWGGTAALNFRDHQI